MIVLSLFDGISCGRVALERAKIPVTKYYASEIDKYAIKVSENNYPDIVRLGDINDWGNWDVDWSSIDLILAGSPCQGFSMAGKQLAFDDKRSALFFRFAEILEHVKSLNLNAKFLLENVRMKKEFESVITSVVGVDPVMINSALVSAQNRKRLYWTNWHFEQPGDKGVLLKDVLEFGYVDREKSYCVDANYGAGMSVKNYFEKSRRQIVADKPFNKININQSGRGANGYIYSIDTYIKSPTLTTNKGEGIKVGQFNKNEITFRKLTPTECERLQTLPDNYTDGVSNTQRYKMLGNGWTVDVIAHILKSLKKEMENESN